MKLSHLFFLRLLAFGAGLAAGWLGLPHPASESAPLTASAVVSPVGEDIVHAIQTHLRAGELELAWALFRATPRSHPMYGAARDVLAEWVSPLLELMESRLADAQSLGDVAAQVHWRQECHFLDPRRCQELEATAEPLPLPLATRPQVSSRSPAYIPTTSSVLPSPDVEEPRVCQQVDLLLMAARATQTIDRAQANLLYQRCRSVEFLGCRRQAECQGPL